MKFRWEKKYLYWGITAFLVIVCSILFFIFFNNFSNVVSGLQVLYQILMPFVIALVFAYLLNPIVNFVENKWMIPLYNVAKRRGEKRRAGKPPKKKKGGLPRVNPITRVLAILITMLFAGMVIVGLLVMVLPQLVQSVIGIADNLPAYLNNLQVWATNLVESNAGLKEVLSAELANRSETILTWARSNLMPQLNTLLAKATQSIFGAVNILKNLLVGIIVSVYLLYSKERFAAQAKKLMYAIFPIKAGNVILITVRRADKVFGGFIIGKLIDSAIIGVLCFVGMSLFNLISPIDMPFVLLISAIVGVTNIIPFFGPFIGAIPSILLILMVSPISAIYFAIFVLLLQQFDGNILGPKILGNSTGLSAFWVMFAILLGGGLFGFSGMLLGVPAFAVIYTIVVELVEARLTRRGIPVCTQAYYDLQQIDAVEEAPPISAPPN